MGAACRHGERRRHGDRRGAGLRQRPIQRGESQVIANGHAQPAPRRSRQDRGVAGAVRFGLAVSFAAVEGRIEHVDFVILRDRRPLVVEQERAIGEAGAVCGAFREGCRRAPRRRTRARRRQGPPAPGGGAPGCVAASRIAAAPASIVAFSGSITSSAPPAAASRTAAQAAATPAARSGVAVSWIQATRIPFLGREAGPTRLRLRALRARRNRRYAAHR